MRQLVRQMTILWRIWIFKLGRNKTNLPYNNSNNSISNITRDYYNFISISYSTLKCFFNLLALYLINGVISTTSQTQSLANILNFKKSQHGCVRWALREHLTPPCYDFACGGLQDSHNTNDGRTALFSCITYLSNKYIYTGGTDI